MYNLQQRISNLFSFAITVLSTVLGAVALISYIQGYASVQGRVSVDANKIKIVSRRFGPENQDYRKPSEFARLSFDIDADFSPLFDWNTKQIFVTVVADYQTDKYTRNSVVIWDKIVTSKEKAKLKLKNVGNKYAMIDVSQKWNYERANISLAWDITPHVGMLQSGQFLTDAQITLPPFSPV
ncbi:hypothetical protein G6F37_010400 [Rhizopus arrhizus]|nr:hypothetical protein G6F38_010451 [Rhizopus arrhizus]KAG1153385.1 hypothetical protein G6F37_010400 [Rhizopus arrhizus]